MPRVEDRLTGEVLYSVHLIMTFGHPWVMLLPSCPIPSIRSCSFVPYYRQAGCTLYQRNSIGHLLPFFDLSLRLSPFSLSLSRSKYTRYINSKYYSYDYEYQGYVFLLSCCYAVHAAVDVVYEDDSHVRPQQHPLGYLRYLQNRTSYCRLFIL